MSQDAVTAVLFSPIGIGAIACAVLALGLLVAPAPRCVLHAQWSLGCVLAALLLGLVALAIIGIGGDWHGGGALLMCAVTVAVGGIWLAQAPLPWEHHRSGLAEAGASEEDDDGGLERPKGPAPLDPTPGGVPAGRIDWDAFDRARAAWSAPRVRRATA
jgi:hypothetical protein